MLTIRNYRALLQKSNSEAAQGMAMMTRNANVYLAEGASLYHELESAFWHRVLMNTETQSRTMANVAFSTKRHYGEGAPLVSPSACRLSVL